MAGPVLKLVWNENWTALTANGASIHSNHDRMSALIRARAGQDAASFLAKPVMNADGDLIGWISPHGGVLAVPSVNAAELNAEANRLRGEIARLADELSAQGDAGALAAYLLRLGITTPEGADAAMVDAGKPVLINWGISAPNQPAIAAPVSSLAPVSATTHAAVTSNDRGFPRALWALPIALVALTGALVWQLSQPAPVETVVVIPPAPAPYDPAPEIRDHIASLDAALLDVKVVEPTFSSLCLSKAEAACVAAKEAPKPKELVIIMDASGSMEYSIDTPQWLDLAIFRAWQNGDQRTLQTLINRAERLPGQSRERVTKSILSDAIASAGPDILVGMTTFRSCTDRPASPLASTAKRAGLIDWMGRIRPTEATAIAASIEDAVSMLKGGLKPSDPVNVLLVSDGLDTCQGDPCAAARAAKRAKPGVRINVIDLAGFDSLKCVASATGGLYRSHEDGMSVSELSMLARSFAGSEVTCGN